MTAQPATLITVGYPRPVIKPGDIVDTWCSKQGYRTPHRYTGHQNTPKGLTCLVCNPESKPEEIADERTG